MWKVLLWINIDHKQIEVRIRIGKILKWEKRKKTVLEGLCTTLEILIITDVGILLFSYLFLI